MEGFFVENSKVFALMLTLLFVGVFGSYTTKGAEADITTIVLPEKQTTLFDTSKTPLSLAIIYHQVTYGYGASASIDIDNGSTAITLSSLINAKTPAILVNGVVAYPLLKVALANYLINNDRAIKPESDARKDCAHKGWTRFCSEIDTTDYEKNAGTTFLTEWTPYLVWFPYWEKEVPGIKPTWNKKLADERFVLFIRNDASFDKTKAFNMEFLEEQKLISGDDTELVQTKTLALLKKIMQHKVTPETLAQSIQYIFNTTQKQYIWNILIDGHGHKSKKLEKPLLTQLATKETEPASVYKQKREGVIANMPPQQFIRLLDFFNTIPVSFIWVSTCYSGGYNAEIVEQEVHMLDTLVNKRRALSTENQQKLALLGEKLSTLADAPEAERLPFVTAYMTLLKQKAPRNFVLIAMTAFDLPSATSDNIGEMMQQLAKLSNEKIDTTTLKERLFWIYRHNISGLNVPIILMPDSSKFELLYEPRELALEELAKSGEIGERSLEFLPPAKISWVLEHALEKNNWPLAQQILTLYADNPAYDLTKPEIITAAAKNGDLKKEFVDFLMKHNGTDGITRLFIQSISNLNWTTAREIVHSYAEVLTTTIVSDYEIAKIVETANKYDPKHKEEINNAKKTTEQLLNFFITKKDGKKINDIFNEAAMHSKWVFISELLSACIDVFNYLTDSMIDGITATTWGADNLINLLLTRKNIVGIQRLFNYAITKQNWSLIDDILSHPDLLDPAFISDDVITAIIDSAPSTFSKQKGLLLVEINLNEKLIKFFAEKKDRARIQFILKHAINTKPWSLVENLTTNFADFIDPTLITDEEITKIVASGFGPTHSLIDFFKQKNPTRIPFIFKQAIPAGNWSIVEDLLLNYANFVDPTLITDEIITKVIEASSNQTMDSLLEKSTLAIKSSPGIQFFIKRAAAKNDWPHVFELISSNSDTLDQAFLMNFLSHMPIPDATKQPKEFELFKKLVNDALIFNAQTNNDTAITNIPDTVWTNMVTPQAFIEAYLKTSSDAIKRQLESKASHFTNLQETFEKTVSNFVEQNDTRGLERALRLPESAPFKYPDELVIKLACDAQLADKTGTIAVLQKTHAHLVEPYITLLQKAQTGQWKEVENFLLQPPAEFKLSNIGPINMDYLLAQAHSAREYAVIIAILKDMSSEKRFAYAKLFADENQWDLLSKNLQLAASLAPSQFSKLLQQAASAKAYTFITNTLTYSGSRLFNNKDQIQEALQLLLDAQQWKELQTCFNHESAGRFRIQQLSNVQISTLFAHYKELGCESTEKLLIFNSKAIDKSALERVAAEDGCGLKDKIAKVLTTKR
jgi:hypothetical protein